MDDAQLTGRVLNELKFNLVLKAEDIRVAVHDGVVTLSGRVSDYRLKIAAERDVRRIKEVRTVEDRIEVSLPKWAVVADDEFETRALTVLSWNSIVTPNAIGVKANKGWLTLSGQLDWQYQRNAAVDAVRSLTGVVGIINNITVRPQVLVEQVKDKIENALKHAAKLEAEQINVVVCGATVTLDGKVRDSAERTIVRNAVTSAPGVQHLDDRLTVA